MIWVFLLLWISVASIALARIVGEILKRQQNKINGGHCESKIYDNKGKN
jgi:hypothetical protein